MTVYYDDGGITVHAGDALDILATLPDCSIDAVVTDPPYGLGFMGKAWDSTAALASRPPSADETDARFNNAYPRTGKGPSAVAFDGVAFDGVAFQTWCEAWAVECLRVLKPGGYMLAFGGTRTWHRLACAVEDAGFEIRDSIAWVFGSGFPKSLNPYRSIMGACPSHALAPHAVRISRFTRVLSSEGKEPTALALARIQPGDAPVLLTETGAADGSPVRTATLLSELATRMNLNTDELWNSLWAVVSAPANTSTTLTTSRTTTASAISWSSRLRTTHANTTPARTLPPGCSCAAFDAGAGLSVTSDGWNSIPVLTAPVSATGGPLAPLNGMGTSTKPAFEPIVVARKPLAGTVASNVLAYGTGALNIDATRVGTDGGTRLDAVTRKGDGIYEGGINTGQFGGTVAGLGRWPANVLLDGTRWPVVRLRDNLPVAIEREIREHFHAGTGHLPPVRETDDGPTVEGGQEGLLLPEVLRGMDVSEHDRGERDPSRDAAHCRVEAEDGRRAVEERAARADFPELARGSAPVQRLRAGELGDFASRPAGMAGTDGDDQHGTSGVTGQVHTGTPAGDGASDRPAPVVVGAGASRQRDQDRQSLGEPGTSRPGIALSGARESRGRVGTLAAGERGAAGAPVEVLLCYVPDEWRDYFDLTGRTSGSQADALDQQSGVQRDGTAVQRNGGGQRIFNRGEGLTRDDAGFGGEGGASRFFPTFRYEAKAPTDERVRLAETAHPTVKPLDLMRWLVRLVTPPDGTVLDPFAGSGTTAEACLLEGFRCITIEREPDYLPLIVQRINRRRDPIAALRAQAEDLGLFGEDTA